MADWARIGLHLRARQLSLLAAKALEGRAGQWVGKLLLSLKNGAGRVSVSLAA